MTEAASTANHRIWEGTDANGTYIWMTDATFQRYVNTWLEARAIADPTPDQRNEAYDHCCRLSYWQNCKDSDVHFVSNRHALEQQRRA